MHEAFSFLLVLVTLFSLRFGQWLTLQQLSSSDLEYQFLVRYQLGLSIKSVSSSCASLQMVKQLIHLLKDC